MGGEKRFSVFYIALFCPPPPTKAHRKQNSFSKTQAPRANEPHPKLKTQTTNHKPIFFYYVGLFLAPIIEYQGGASQERSVDSCARKRERAKLLRQQMNDGLDSLHEVLHRIITFFVAGKVKFCMQALGGRLFSGKQDLLHRNTAGFGGSFCKVQKCGYSRFFGHLSLCFVARNPRCNNKCF